LWYHTYKIFAEVFMKKSELPLRIFFLTLITLFSAPSSFGGVSRAIQDQYRKDYENKAMFLKIPIYAEKQTIAISGQSFRVEPGSGPTRYKVGDQLRVLAIDFSGDEVKFRMGGIAAAGMVELVFRFDAALQETFPNKDVFDRALRSVLTEGLKYTDIDDAKESFVKEQFDRSVKEIAGSASTSRETVLKTIAPFLPAYQEAQRDIENLRSRIQDVSAQLSQSQSENRKLEGETRAQQAELSRLKNLNAALQDKLDSYASQLSKLGNEVKDARGNTQGLTAQIADLGQSMKKLQKDNQALANQIGTLRSNLEAQQATNARLVSDSEELKSGNRKLQSRINELTSKDDSLAKRYVDLGNERDKLDDYVKAVRAVRTQLVQESTEDGIYFGRASVYLNNVLLGSLDWRISVSLSRDEAGSGEANFTSESIDYVRVTPEERHILKSLGAKLKLRVSLASSSDSMTVSGEEDKGIREIGERDHSAWKWSIENKGTRDARLLLTARLINKDSREISLLQQEPSVGASSVVRRFRGYLQPIPLVAGIIIGFVLFGIVGIFRKPKSRVERPADPPSPYVEKKRL
jgi:predicted nuclease with TOPRIM domain